MANQIPHPIDALEDAHPAMAVEEILCMHIFPRCTFKAQAMINCTCRYYNELWYYKYWIPETVRRNHNSNEWWVAYDIMRHKGYGFHNGMVQDWAEFLNGLRFVFAEEEASKLKRKREEANHPCREAKRIKIEEDYLCSLFSMFCTLS